MAIALLCYNHSDNKYTKIEEDEIKYVNSQSSMGAYHQDIIF
jgi:hypothetical protein